MRYPLWRPGKHAILYTMLRPLILALALLPAAATNHPPPADPLTATIHTEDADRFAGLYAKTKGKPTAAQLKRDYLDKGSFGIGVFTPGRIVDADTLARAIAANPTRYAQAIKTCLPAAKAATDDLRAIYLGLHGALPDVKLPQVYIVFGAGNSGGTAGPGAQVLGLEVLCRMSPTPEKLRQTLRHFFAHETVHSFQQDAGMTLARDPLLTAILVEGAADFIAQLVTGEEPDAARAAWAAPREAELWRQMQADIALTRKLTDQDDPEEGSPEAKAYARWIGNYSTPPTGWPPELGYWMGLRIWQRYYAAAPDKHAALRAMLAVRDPRVILAAGPYRRR
ncbi:hypothetical protein U1737_10690 [Sphingomonas sp. LB3N6]|uniref:hypothetical protein n=1 Tax=Sphingomonas fucosidasi TaxID=3096164 RepID=UPI002FCC546C